MTVSVQSPVNDYVANGSVTTFPYTFYVGSNSQLAVYVNGVQVVTGFTVTGVGNPSGGNVVFSLAPANGAAVRIRRVMILDRQVDYTEGAAFSSTTVDADIDNTVIQLQNLDSLTLKKNLGDDNLSLNGNRITDVGLPVNANDVATKNWSETAGTTFVNQSAASAAAAAASESSAAASASTATTQASIATGQATISTTKAGEASASATSAAGSAATSTNQATISTTQAGIATTKAGEAATSAANASTSETNAAASAASAASSYDAFDDRYLGSKAANPTLDNDGNALLTGALYFNTAANEMRVWTGSAWSASYLPAGAYIQKSGDTMTGALTLSGAPTNTLHAATKAYVDGTVTSITGTANQVTASASTGAVTLSLPQSIHTAATPTFAAMTLGSGNLTFSTTAQRIRGDTTNATIANRLMFQDSTANSGTSVGSIPNGTGTYSGYQAFNSSSPNNASLMQIYCDATAGTVESTRTGTGTYLPLTFRTNGAEAMRIDTSGRVQVYGNAVSWGSVFKTLGVGNLQLSYSTGAGDSFIAHNTYYDGTNWRAINTGGSSFNQHLPDGGRNWWAAPSVTAGAVASPTVRMQLDANGRLIVGPTGSLGNCRLALYGGLNASGSSHYDAFMYMENTAGGNYVNIGFHTPAASQAGTFKFYGPTVTFECRNYNDGNFIPIAASAFNVNSDYRLKENVVPLTGAVDRLMTLPVYRFNFIDKPERTVDGFLAHEVGEVVAEACSGMKDAMRSDGTIEPQQIDQSKIVPLVTAAVQEMYSEIVELRQRIESLEAGNV